MVRPRLRWARTYPLGWPVTDRPRHNEVMTDTGRPPSGSSEEEATTQLSARKPRRHRRRVVTVAAALLLAGGIGVLGYVGYQLFGSNVTARHAHQSERHHLRSKWHQSGHAGSSKSGSPAATGKKHPTKTTSGTAKSDKDKSDKESKPSEGDGTGLLSIPSIGVDKVPVLEGTSQHVLAQGIGHYSDTGRAGQVGNFAVAGHRITHGEPFSRLLDVKKGDKVIMETRDVFYTYKIDKSPKKLTVQDTETWVLDPVPGKKDAKPHKRRITLTTCQDLFHSPNRSVGFGKLVHARQK